MFLLELEKSFTFDVRVVRRSKNEQFRPGAGCQSLSSYHGNCIFSLLNARANSISFRDVVTFVFSVCSDQKTLKNDHLGCDRSFCLKWLKEIMIRDDDNNFYWKLILETVINTVVYDGCGLLHQNICLELPSQYRRLPKKPY